MRHIATDDEIAEILQSIKNTKLRITSDTITEFPEDFRFPDGLTELTVAGHPERPSRLTHLPPLPDTLTDLTVQFAPDFQRLPELPALNTLSVGHTALTELPELPPSLTELYASGNKLTRLPPLEHTKLTMLYVQRNKLEAIPPLPLTVETLSASENPIRAIPDLPASVRRVYLDDYRLDEPYKTLYKAYARSGYTATDALRRSLKRFTKRIGALQGAFLDRLHRPPNEGDPEGGLMYRRGKDSFYGRAAQHGTGRATRRQRQRTAVPEALRKASAATRRQRTAVPEALRKASAATRRQRAAAPRGASRSRARRAASR